MSEPKLRAIIENYLIDADLKETLHDPKLDLGFRFFFPKGVNPQGKPNGRPFTIIKSKNRGMLEITSPVTISIEHVKALDSMKKGSKEKFFRKLIKQFILKEVFFSIGIKNNRYAVIDNIFLNKGKIISKNLLYNSIRKVLGCVLYSILEIQDFCSGEFDISDLKLV